MNLSPAAHRSKAPRPIVDTVFAFPPNRDTLGGTAYLVVQQKQDGRPENLLIDAPAWHESHQEFLDAQGGVRWLCITHRGNLGQAREIHERLGCELIIQEQEAYLLPNLPVTPFQHSFHFSETLEILWTPGHSPGSACVYYAAEGGILFTGRHLLPDQQGLPVPLRFSKTFHWPRQLRQVKRLQQQFSVETLQLICPGANIGFLRGNPGIGDAYPKLQSIDTDALYRAEPLL